VDTRDKAVQTAAGRPSYLPNLRTGQISLMAELSPPYWVPTQLGRATALPEGNLPRARPTRERLKTGSQAIGGRTRPGSCTVLHMRTNFGGRAAFELAPYWASCKLLGRKAH